MDEYVYYSELLKAIEYHEIALEELRRKVKQYEERASVDHELFSSKIRIILKENGISQSELAKQLGVCQKTVSRYVTGQAIPNKAREKRIMTALNICIANRK